jgi:hypothetical protein
LPTHEESLRFLADYHRLSAAEQAAFRRAVKLFRVGLLSGRFHPSLRVKSYKSVSGWNEMTWAPNGRALWAYGKPIPGGHGPHIIWLRVGTHDIYKDL